MDFFILNCINQLQLSFLMLELLTLGSNSPSIFFWLDCLILTAGGGEGGGAVAGGICWKVLRSRGVGNRARSEGLEVE